MSPGLAPRARGLWARWSWAVLAGLLAAGLVIGAGVRLGGGAPTRAQRIHHLDRIIGCPSCADLSVAESNAVSAVAIRRYVASQVNAGVSDRAVLSSVTASYGAKVLLQPPTAGAASLVWVLPGVGVGAGVAGLVALFGLRRRRSTGTTPAATDDDRTLVEGALRR